MVNFNGDRQWFRISLQSGRTYRFDLSGNTLSDPILNLLNSTGSDVLASNDNFWQYLQQFWQAEFRQ